MKTMKIMGVALMILALAVGCQKKAEPVETNQVLFKTTLGEFVVELDYTNAPISAKNFAQYVREGFYDNTIFHRVIPGFVVQSGGWTEGLEQKMQHEPIQNEADNGFKNLRGTLSYGRTSAPHSATTHFFINLVNNPSLDYQGEHYWGYAVFGKVVKGMNVVDAIAAQPTGPRKRGPQTVNDVPVEPVIIKSAKIILEENK